MDDIRRKIYARCDHPDYGRESDILSANRLSKDKMYAVGDIFMGQSSTFVILAGIDDIFNSVNFEFFRKDGDEYIEHDIFSDPNLNPYLSVS